MAVKIGIDLCSYSLCSALRQIHDELLKTITKALLRQVKNDQINLLFLLLRPRRIAQRAQHQGW